MRQVLYIVSNPKSEEQSVSLQIGRSFIDQYQAFNPNDDIDTIDVYKDPIPLVDHDVLLGWDRQRQGDSVEEFPKKQRDKVLEIDRLTQQFIDTDLYVFVVPMWNFGVPPMLKAYIDTFKVARKTFKYTEEGPIGLLTNKQAVIIQARGSVYSGDNQKFEHSVSHLQSVLSFMGVEEIHTIVAEGMNLYSAEECEEIKQSAVKQAKQLAQRLQPIS
jgi:FMN-dependent NADH-azoreductase